MENIEVVQLPKDQFSSLCKLVEDNKTFIKENKDALATSSEKQAEFDRRVADFDNYMQEFREAKASSKLWGAAYNGGHFKSPVEALMCDSDDIVIREWQKKADLVYIASVLASTPNVSWLSEKLRSGNDSKWSDFVKNFQAETKAMYEGGTGVGAEWVPTILSSELYREVRLALKVANLHPRFNMTSNNVEIPSKSGAVFAELISEASSDSSTKITAKTHSTRKIAFSAKKFGLRTLTSTELDEDAIIPTLQAIREDIVYALSTAEEYAVINGDTAGTQDTKDQNGDVIHAKSNLKAWDGYRKISKNQGQAIISSGGTLTAAHVRKMFASMGKFAVDVTKLAMVTSTQGYFKQFLALGNVQTLDKLGPNAVILTGQLGQYHGVPIIVSEWVRKDVGASGYSGGTSAKNKTSIVGVRTDAFRIGDSRAIKVETEKDIDTDQIKVVGTRRLDFKNMYTTAAANTVIGEIKGLS